jgi:ribosomal protein S18 acetylase RimI-like enzyme
VSIECIERVPTAAEYLALRQSVGWHGLSATASETGLAHSLYAVCAQQGSEVVGCGRIVGDGGVYFYIQDLVVRPEYQRRELGTQIMKKLMGYIERHAQSGAFIGLMAAPGLEDFYARFSFTRFPEDSPGMLIWK